MTVDVSLFFRPHLAPGGDPVGVIDVGRIADRVGLHSILFGEHLVMGPRTETYPYGPFRHADDAPWLDPFTTLAAIAAVTKDLRLGAGVILAPLRPAVVLAKSIATLDVLSRGRVELGVGTGWQQHEYAAAGYAWAERNRRFDESLEICRLLWTGERVSRSFATADLDGVVAFPVPVQPRVPLLFGMAMNAANAERVARLGDGWCPVGVDAQGVAVGSTLLRSAFERAGRDPSSVRIRVAVGCVFRTDGSLDTEATFSAADPFVAAGATEISAAPDAPFADAATLEAFVADLGSASKRYRNQPSSSQHGVT